MQASAYIGECCACAAHVHVHEHVYVHAYVHAYVYACTHKFQSSSWL